MTFAFSEKRARNGEKKKKRILQSGHEWVNCNHSVCQTELEDLTVKRLNEGETEIESEETITGVNKTFFLIRQGGGGGGGGQ